MSNRRCVQWEKSARHARQLLPLLEQVKRQSTFFSPLHRCDGPSRETKRPPGALKRPPSCTSRERRARGPPTLLRGSSCFFSVGPRKKKRGIWGRVSRGKPRRLTLAASGARQPPSPKLLPHAGRHPAQPGAPRAPRAPPTRDLLFTKRTFFFSGVQASGGGPRRRARAAGLPRDARVPQAGAQEDRTPAAAAQGVELALNNCPLCFIFSN